MLGMGYVQQLKGHVNVDLVAVMLPPQARKILLVIAAIASIVVVAIMAFTDGKWQHGLAKAGQGTPRMRPALPPTQ